MENLVAKKIVKNFGKNISVEKLFNQLKDSMVTAIRRELKGVFAVKDSSQLSLGEFSQRGFGEERDGQVYPFVRLDVHVTSLDGTQSADFVYSIGLFECCYFELGHEFEDEGIQDISTTKAHRKIMREKYGEEEYDKMVSSYKYRVRKKMDLDYKIMPTYKAGRDVPGRVID